MSSYMLLPLLLSIGVIDLPFIQTIGLMLVSLTRPEYDLYTNIAVQP